VERNRHGARRAGGSRLARTGNPLDVAELLRAAGELDEETLREFCRGKIARFKIPELVRFVDAFPMTVTGKVQKFKMRELEIAERGLVESKTA